MAEGKKEPRVRTGAQASWETLACNAPRFQKFTFDRNGRSTCSFMGWQRVPLEHLERIKRLERAIIALLIGAALLIAMSAGLMYVALK